MMKNEHLIRLICTLGPSSLDAQVLKRLDELGVTMFRLNMSHTSIAQLDDLIRHIKRTTMVPLCIDTEGAQIRTGTLAAGSAKLHKNDTVTLLRQSIQGTESAFTLTPADVFDHLKPGMLLSVDFNAVLLMVIESSLEAVHAKVLCGGCVGSNKGVSADHQIPLPPITEKDRQAIEIARSNHIDLFALSFASDASAVAALRQLTGPGATVISKVESHKALMNIDEIIAASDAILIDRGDLSRDVAVEQLPFLQKSIIRKAHQKPIPVYVATNLLESMMASPHPTRAEVNDIASTLFDGANGLVLAAETAIGRHPIRCVSMVRRIINQYLAESWQAVSEATAWHGNGLLQNRVLPHGGALIDCLTETQFDQQSLARYQVLHIDLSTVREVEQIAKGSYSPLRGFMNRHEINSVLESYKLEDGTVWTLPVVLQATVRELRGAIGDTVVLVCRCCDQAVGLLRITDVYVFDVGTVARRWFGTADLKHPGVARLCRGGDCFLGGEVTLLKEHGSTLPAYSLSPAQVRSIFAHNGWDKVVGFHTRNVPHRGHEYIQLASLERIGADALFIHPAIGQKRPGDFTPEAILAGYDALIEAYYPSDRVLLSGFYTNSWYAGPREAVFTAICRKNFGCSHFIVGRDHTGVGEFYSSGDVMALFEKLGDIGIEPVYFDTVMYDPDAKQYCEVRPADDGAGLLEMSGTLVRRYLVDGNTPPDFMMRPEVAAAVLQLSSHGKRMIES